MTRIIDTFDDKKKFKTLIVHNDTNKKIRIKTETVEEVLHLYLKEEQQKKKKKPQEVTKKC